MNQIIIAGHLGADPEVRFTSSGQKVTTLRVATRVRRGGKDKDETIWWRVTVWGEQFDKMIPYLKKGSPLIVCGELNKPEIFTDREGRPQISMSITASNLQFSPFGRPDHASPAGEGGEGAHHHAEMAYAAADQIVSGQGKAEPALSQGDDEIPF
ncbi:MAG TPA: single-stranded DNA-binding protein [Rhabdochlamydiaceae bacterium]|jgi:single-strand DNA-binding protein